MDLRLMPAPLSGRIAAIPSKSAAHRLLIAAALGDRPALLRCGKSAQDIKATVRCLRALGADISHREDGLIHVVPIPGRRSSAALDCGESGSTLRFLLPVAAALCDRADFSGHGRLPDRPHSPLVEQMAAHGAEFSAARLPFSVSRMRQGGVFTLPGNISSQFISGLLLAAPLLGEEVTVCLSLPLESAGYVTMTVETLARFGIAVKQEADRFFVPSGARYHTPEGVLPVAGDWSNAAFWLAAGALSGGVCCTGLDTDSAQGDREILSLLRKMGACVSETPGCVSVSPAPLSAICADVSDIPDLVPALAVAAAVSQGETRITGAGRLRFKESDRIATVCEMIRTLGGDAEEQPEGLVIRGGQTLTGGIVHSRGDHRIVMAAAVAASICTGPVTIVDADAVNKSYPGFFDDYQLLGGKLHVL